MDASVVSSNVRRLRVAAGKSQAAAADAAGLSRVGYRNIESGQAEPRIATLQRIATALGVRLEDLLTPGRQLKGVRFRAQKRMTSREELIARIGGWLDEYAELERLVGDQQKFQFAKVRKQLPALRGPDRARAAAELARRAVGLKSDELIRDICGLLEEEQDARRDRRERRSACAATLGEGRDQRPGGPRAHRCRTRAGHLLNRARRAARGNDASVRHVSRLT